VVRNLHWVSLSPSHYSFDDNENVSLSNEWNDIIGPILNDYDTPNYMITCALSCRQRDNDTTTTTTPTLVPMTPTTTQTTTKYCSQNFNNDSNLTSTCNSTLKVAKETTYHSSVHDNICTPIMHNTPGPVFESSTPTATPTRPVALLCSNCDRKAPTCFGYDDTEENGYVAEVAEVYAIEVEKRNRLHTFRKRV
jgi:hypothetical protein